MTSIVWKIIKLFCSILLYDFAEKYAFYRGADYFVLVFNYDRGHFGCNIVYGNDAIALLNSIEWDDDCDFTIFWKEIDEQIRLRIPDKYLQAHGWL